MREPEPGAPDTDNIFNGAYDNASGCAGLLEIAKRLRARRRSRRARCSSSSRPPKSRDCSARNSSPRNPSLPLDKIAANINVDGINYLGHDEAT